MYDMMELILAVLVILYGIFMIACPKQSTKKKYRDDPAKVATMRKVGFIWVICGIILFILQLSSM